MHLMYLNQFCVEELCINFVLVLPFNYFPEECGISSIDIFP